MKRRPYPKGRKPAAMPSQMATGGAALAVPSSRPGPRAPSKKRGSPEADFQMQAVSLLRLILPEPCRVWFCPNGGNLSEAQAAKFQKMGLLAGVHDLHVMVPGYCCAALYTLECKAGRGKLRPEQADFGEAVELCGGGWWEVRTLEDVATAAEYIAGRHQLTLRPVTITPGGFVWDRGAR